MCPRVVVTPVNRLYVLHKLGTVSQVEDPCRYRYMSSRALSLELPTSLSLFAKANDPRQTFHKSKWRRPEDLVLINFILLSLYEWNATTLRENVCLFNLTLRSLVFTLRFITAESIYVLCLYLRTNGDLPITAWTDLFLKSRFSVQLLFQTNALVFYY
jgi:hypothetical protein